MIGGICIEFLAVNSPAAKELDHNSSVLCMRIRIFVLLLPKSWE